MKYIIIAQSPVFFEHHAFKIVLTAIYDKGELSNLKVQQQTLINDEVENELLTNNDTEKSALNIFQVYLNILCKTTMIADHSYQDAFNAANAKKYVKDEVDKVKNKILKVLE